ncbi:MAG: hypothetical protein AABX11_03055 [Nanoarchaeota archaeon]
MDYVKVHYRRIKIFKFIPTPFYHTFLEIELNGKNKIIGYYNKDSKSNSTKFLVSIFKFVKGEVIPDTQVMDTGIIISKDSKKIKKLLKAINSTKWTDYHALKKNCFDWRNTVLNKANIPVPRDKWWKKAG